MTTHTALRARGGVMHRGKRLGHLAPRRGSSPGAMTVTTLQILTRGVLGMAEINLVSTAGDRQALILARLMANIAGRQIASPFLSARAVTLIAGRVRALPTGYRERHAAIGRLMTGSTSGAGMFRVTEFGVKALQR